MCLKLLYNSGAPMTSQVEKQWKPEKKCLNDALRSKELPPYQLFSNEVTRIGHRSKICAQLKGGSYYAKHLSRFILLKMNFPGLWKIKN